MLELYAGKYDNVPEIVTVIRVQPLKGDRSYPYRILFSDRPPPTCRALLQPRAGPISVVVRLTNRRILFTISRRDESSSYEREITSAFFLFSSFPPSRILASATLFLPREFVGIHIRSSFENHSECILRVYDAASWDYAFESDSYHRRRYFLRIAGNCVAIRSETNMFPPRYVTRYVRELFRIRKVKKR